MNCELFSSRIVVLYSWRKFIHCEAQIDTGSKTELKDATYVRTVCTVNPQFSLISFHVPILVELT